MSNKNKYIAPGRNLDSFTCPHCNVLSLMTFGIHHFDQDIITDEMNNPLLVNNFGYESYTYSNELKIARCHSCGKKIIWIDNEYVYPNIVAEEVNPDLPESVKQLYNEAGLIYNQSLRAADLVRVVGNNAVHPGKIAFDVDDITTAKSLMRLINMIGQIMITDPKDIDNMYSQLPESTQKSIERRDGK
ncbi:hypothetical protein [Prevotella intermedia]|uniref:hypothetical protein n=1 Tax=Prevotella intermedia TaxID=28131 RepID=UPI003979EA94